MRKPFNVRRPKRVAKAVCFDSLRSDGWVLSSRGWPDYFATRDGGKQVAAFYASTRRRLRQEQTEVATVLSALGLPCFHVTLDGSTIPIP